MEEKTTKTDNQSKDSEDIKINVISILLGLAFFVRCIFGFNWQIYDFIVDNRHFFKPVLLIFGYKTSL